MLFLIYTTLIVCKRPPSILKEEFADLIVQHKALIYKVSKLYTNTLEDEQDLFQEIVFQLWKSYSSFKGEAKITTWMYRVGMNTAIASLNKKKRAVSTITPIEIPDVIDDNSTQVQENIDALYKAIKRLNVIDRGVTLLFLEGNSYKQIGEIMGYTENNVGTRMGRIREKLKQLM